MSLNTYLKTKSINSPIESEIQHWKNNYILDGFFADLATKKGLIKNYAEFNSSMLELNSSDLKFIISSINEYLVKRFPFDEKNNGEIAKLEWEKSLKTFQLCLKNIDFKNSSLYYLSVISE